MAFARRRTRFVAAGFTAALIAPLFAAVGYSGVAQSTPPGEVRMPTSRRAWRAAESEGRAFQEARSAYYESRRTAGDKPLSIEKAGALRGQAATKAKGMKSAGATTSTASVPAWSSVGPNTVQQVGRTTNSLEVVAGRIAALAVNSAGRVYAGAAQGGVWSYDENTGAWTSLTDSLTTLAVGALEIAPSNENVLYLGSGEGALSGDSYFGDGVYRSTDGGTTWSKRSGSTFAGVSTAGIAVDPANADHLYIAIVRGRAGARRTTPPTSTVYGVYESTNGGATWALRKGTTNAALSATDVDVDPQNANVVYASFWGDGLYKSTDHGLHWAPAMTGLPAGDWNGLGTRFSTSVSHPAGEGAVLYTGFDWIDADDGDYHAARLFRSDDNAAHWTELPTGPDGIDSVLGYCGEQCSYDNVVEADPVDSDVVYAGGMYNYGLASGGIYRSTNGGQDWLSLGYDLHPDFHALAFQPGDPAHVVLGNDGGVWQSFDRGGRLGVDETLEDTTWENINAGLNIAQMTSIAYDPGRPRRFWAGTQDNGTQFRSGGSPSTPSMNWNDVGLGDGGQVLVDPGNGNMVFGTHYDISPYRFDVGPTGALQFGGYTPITQGIDLSDRSEFYVPWVMNKGNTNQLVLGTHRLYRTDNAETADPNDVMWEPISPDLSSGCPGSAPNGARGCFISAIGVADGGTGVYVGTDDGYVSVSPNATTAAAPSWKRMDKGALPARPITQFAVDRSNWRTAYVSYGSFNASTPNKPGHVFKTTDGGKSWKNVSGALPDNPVNSILLDPSDPNTLFAGTDVGAFVTHDGGTNWARLGTGLPQSAIWQLDYDPARGLLVAGTHGRGAWTLDTGRTAPALVLSQSVADVPVGAGSNVEYSLKIRNIGNQNATGVKVVDLLPVNTSFVSASNGGTLAKGRVNWSNLSVPAGGSTTVTFTVRISPSLASTVTSIVNDKVDVTSAQGPGTTGSPLTTPIAPAHGLTVVPATQTDGARAGDSVTYPVTVRNIGYLSDTVSFSAANGWSSVSVLDPTCTTPLAATGSIAPGASTTVCVKVGVPAAATDGTVDHATVTATSGGDAAVHAAATIDTIAVTIDTLLVDDDLDGPDVRAKYADALTAAGITFATWDIAANDTLPVGYTAAHKNVVWFTGNVWPNPVTPYEDALKALLDGGGNLFMSGQDILDQSAGTTELFADYLHIDWDGSEVQNDKPTDAVHGVPANPVTGAVGTVPLDLSVLGGAAFMDQISLSSPALPAFTDDADETNGMTLDTGTYKAVFLAFPFEEYGTATQKKDLVADVFGFFGS
jgi:uncharacterized repeat protein (TIGR01451 family)